MPYLLRIIPAATVSMSFPIHFRVSPVVSGVDLFSVLNMICIPSLKKLNVAAVQYRCHG